VNAFVGHVRFPVAEKSVFFGQGLEASPFERVVAEVRHPALHLSLVLGHLRTAGHHVEVVMATELRQLRVDVWIKPIGLEHRGLEIIQIEQERDAAKMTQRVLQAPKEALAVLAHHRFAVALARVT
jgi:hypothetical protein